MAARYDYFRSQALSSMTSYSLLAQKAEAEGFDGSEAVEQSVQDTFADLDAAAASAGYTRAQYIKAVCGPLVNEKVFERNVRLEALGSGLFRRSCELPRVQRRRDPGRLRRRPQELSER